MSYAIDLQMADLEYKSVLCGDECHVINRVIGVRYANLEQDMTANYRINGVTTVNTELDFEGIGPRFGLEGEWLGSDGVYFFGNGHANLLLGEFRGDFRQMNNLVIQQARAGFQDDRIVPQLELELGIGCLRRDLDRARRKRRLQPPGAGTGHWLAKQVRKPAPEGWLLHQLILQFRHDARLH